MVLIRVFIVLFFLFTINDCNMLNLENSHGYETSLQNFYSYTSVHVNKFEQCTDQKFKSELFKILKEYKCQPRDAVIQLRPIQDNFSLIPREVIVKRCMSHGCHNRHYSCIPIDQKIIQIPLNIIDLSTIKDNRKCGWINIIEHTSCKCGCAVMEQHCNQMQIYDNEKCSCMCRNEIDDKLPCISDKNKRWNNKSCSCECKEEMTCSKDTEWIPRKCQCMQVFDPDANRYETPIMEIQ